MKISRIKRTRPTDRYQIARAMIKQILRSCRSRRGDLFIKWRGGRKKFDENTHDPKERMAWELDD